MVAAESSNWVFIGCEIFLFSLVLNWVAGGIFPSQVKSRRRKNAWRKSNKQQFGPRPRNYRKKRIVTKALLPRHAEVLSLLQIDPEGDEMAAERKAETERLAECRKEKDAALMRHAEEVARQQQEAKAAREAAKTDALANATTIARGSVIHPKLISAAPRHLHVYLSKPKVALTPVSNIVTYTLCAAPIRRGTLCPPALTAAVNRRVKPDVSCL